MMKNFPPFKLTINGILQGCIECDPNHWPFKFDKIYNLEVADYIMGVLGEIEIQTIMHKSLELERKNLAFRRNYYGYI